MLHGLLVGMAAISAPHTNNGVNEKKEMQQTNFTNVFMI